MTAAPLLDDPRLAEPDDDRGSVPTLDELDPTIYRPDLADTVVGIGEVPPLVAPTSAKARFGVLRGGRFRSLEMPTDRLRGWIVTLVLTAVGGFIRFWDIGGAVDGGSGVGVGTPLFDEKYYAVQAAEVVRNLGVEDNQAFAVVVHPPLGKQLIGLGEMLVGYNPAGWRFSSAVAGTLIILLMVRVVRRMTRSTLVGGIAGVLIICDSVSHVLARMALLDIFQELFILAAFACLIADRDQVRARFQRAVYEGFLTTPRPENTSAWSLWWRATPWAGIAQGARWWRFGCGLCLGLTTAIKYNGIYWVVGFGLLAVIWDILARKEAGIRRPIAAVVRRDLIPNIWALAVLPILVYVASWWAWLSSETGYPRHIYCADANTPCGAWKSGGGTGGMWHTLADLWHNSLWQYTWYMLDFHSTLLTPANPSDRHPWESKPWTWPMGTRPVLTYVSSGQSCGNGSNDCVGRIWIIGIPALWWIALFVAAWALWRAIGRLDWRYAAVLVGYGFGYFPWFANLDRQMYFFYVAGLAPFLVIGISLVLGDILGRVRVGVERRYLSIAVVSIYVGLVVANFIWMLPILNGTPITQEHLNMETWIPSWG